MQYKFKSGLTVEGSVEEILQISKAINEPIDPALLPRQKGYYFSESKHTYVKISDMDEMHIRNALCKASREYYQVLSQQRTIPRQEFMRKFISFGDDVLIQDLFYGLQRK